MTHLGNTHTPLTWAHLVAADAAAQRPRIDERRLDNAVRGTLTRFQMKRILDGRATLRKLDRRIIVARYYSA